VSSLFDDALARAINSEPWQPLPGMVKLRCQLCAYWFATRDADVPYCPDCEIRLRRKPAELSRLQFQRRERSTQ
jgi:hypothetical protein